MEILMTDDTKGRCTRFSMFVRRKTSSSKLRAGAVSANAPVERAVRGSQFTICNPGARAQHRYGRRL